MWGGRGGRGGGERVGSGDGESNRGVAQERGAGTGLDCGGESTGWGGPRRHGTAGYVTLHDLKWLSNATGRITHEVPTGGRALLG